MALAPAAGEPPDSQFNELEFDNAPPSPSIIFHNTLGPTEDQPPILQPLIPNPSQPLTPNPPPMTAPIQQAGNLWQTFLPGTTAPTAGPSERAPRRCARCCKYNCVRRKNCPGRGGHVHCTCPHPPLAPREKVNIPESVIEANIARLAQSQ
jgi:hypothetical protein